MTQVERTSTPKERRFQKRKQAAMDAAAAVFAEKGYHGASTRDIADLLDIQQSGLYHYVASKEEALQEVCRIGVEGFIQRLEAILKSSDSPAEKVRAAIFNHLLPMRDLRDYVWVFVNERRHLPPENRAESAELARHYEGLFQRLIEDGAAAGAFRADLDHRITVLGIIGLCNSVSKWYGKEPDADIEDIAANLAGLVLGGLKVK